jgi:hypothetical protein
MGGKCASEGKKDPRKFVGDCVLIGGICAKELKRYAMMIWIR